MEEASERTMRQAEAAQGFAKPTPKERGGESPSIIEALHRPKDELNKIRDLKERLLLAGAMTIEPLEGDPFVLSREHQSTGEGVTVYTPGGGAKKMSIEEYRAQLARERKAAQFFSQQPDVAPSPVKHLGERAMNWLTHALSTFWSKLWSRA